MLMMCAEYWISVTVVPQVCPPPLELVYTALCSYCTVYAQCREALVCQFFESSCRGRWLFLLETINCYFRKRFPFLQLHICSLLHLTEPQSHSWTWTLFGSWTRNLFLQLNRNPIFTVPYIWTLTYRNRWTLILFVAVLHCTVLNCTVLYSICSL